VPPEVELLKAPLDLPAHFPANVEWEAKIDADWSSVRELRVSVTLPADVPRGTTMLCFLTDTDDNWFQFEPGEVLKSGKTNQIHIDMTASSDGWLPRGHNRQWDGYVTQKVRTFGVKIFNERKWDGAVRIDRVHGRTAPEELEPLAVVDLRANCGPAAPGWGRGSTAEGGCATRVPRFGKYELSFDLTRIYSNPYDPDEVDITAKVTSPSGGKTWVHPAFCTHDYIRRKTPLGREQLSPVGKSYWKFRWTPDEEGKWKVELGLYDNHQEEAWKRAVADAQKLGKKDLPKKDDFVVRVAPMEFECVPSDSHGFVAMDPKDPFFFAYRDGTFFYPIGQMLRSPTDLREPYPQDFEVKEGEGTLAYDRMMTRLAENGVNHIRVWMGIWWMGLEAPRNYALGYEGLGRYNQQNAWKLDHIMEEAGRLGIYVKINLNNHGQLSRRVDQEWFESAYSQLYGGMLKNPYEFWTNPEAEKQVKKRLRYVVARWGYSPNVLAWEMWNEVDLTEGFDPTTVANWHRKFGQWIKSIDPWKHPVTTHFYGDDQAAAVYSLPEIDFTPGDLYHANVVSAMRNIWFLKKDYGKGTLISEFGVGKDPDSLEANFHGGLWSSTVLPMAGTAMFWWWNYVDAKDLYYHYKAVAAFNKGEDRREKKWQLSGARVKKGDGNFPELHVLGRQNPTEAHLWIYDAEIYNSNDGARYRSAPTFTGGALVVAGLQPGKYRVEFWDTYKAKVVQSSDVTVEGGSLQVPIPTFKTDIAAKVKRAQ
jgi:hypothetical protein